MSFQLRSRMLVVCAIFLSFFAASALQKNNTQSLKQRTIIAWDLHSVVFKRVFPWFGESVKPISGTIEIIEQLDKQSVEQHVLSNMTFSQYQKVKKKYPHITRYFNKVQVKTDKVEKPKRAYYERFLKNHTINLTTTRVIFIDDNDENIEAAKRMGIETVHFKNPTQCRLELAKKGITV